MVRVGWGRVAYQLRRVSARTAAVLVALLKVPISGIGIINQLITRVLSNEISISHVISHVICSVLPVLFGFEQEPLRGREGYPPPPPPHPLSHPLSHPPPPRRAGAARAAARRLAGRLGADRRECQRQKR